MTLETSTRIDGGFFVRGNAIVKSASCANSEWGVVGLFSDLLVSQFPDIAYAAANHLNREAGLPEIALSKKLRERAA